jgi:hypothetical protein
MRAILIASFNRALVPTSALPQKKWKDYVERNDPENIFNQVRELGVRDVSDQSLNNSAANVTLFIGEYANIKKKTFIEEYSSWRNLTWIISWFLGKLLSGGARCCTHVKQPPAPSNPSSCKN